MWVRRPVHICSGSETSSNSQLPKNRKQRFKDKPLSDLLDRESKTATDCLDVVTINNKYLIKMAAVINWIGYVNEFRLADNHQQGDRDYE